MLAALALGRRQALRPAQEVGVLAGTRSGRPGEARTSLTPPSPASSRRRSASPAAAAEAPLPRGGREFQEEVEAPPVPVNTGDLQARLRKAGEIGRGTRRSVLRLVGG